MKKILLFTTDFPPNKGGVANYYKNVCAYLPSDRIFVLTDYNGSEKEFDSSQKYKIYRENLILKMPIWPKWIFSFFYLWKIIKRERIDIILIGQILPLGTVALIHKKLFKTPYAVFIHGMDLGMAQRKKRKANLAKKILRNAEFIITNSEYTQKLVIGQGIEANKIQVVYPCVETRNYTNVKTCLRRQANSREKKLLTVGRLVKRKGQDMVIKALPKVIEKFPELIYMVAGNGLDRNYLESIAKECNIEKNVKFFGEISDEKKFELLAECDIFIMSARNIDGDVEGFGIVYLEAALYGKPVVAGRSGGISEAVLDGKTGLLVNPESIDEIADAIIKLLSNPDLANKFGVQGMERVLREFTTEKQGEKIRKLLQ